MNTTKQVVKNVASDLRGSEVFSKRERATMMGRIYSFCLVDDVLRFEVIVTGFAGELSSIPPEWKVGEVLPRVYAIRGVSGKTRLQITTENEVIEVYLKDHSLEGEEPQEQMAKIVQFPVRQ